MKKLLIIISIGLVVIGCKKKESDPVPDNTTKTTTTAELSSPLFETQYGDAYDYVDIGENPITILSSNDIIVSSIHYDGTIDKLQISKINATGGLLWQKTFSQGYQYKSGKCFETATGDLIVIGATIAPSNWTYSKVYIAKLNAATGDTIWTRSYGYNYIDGGIVGYEDSGSNYWIVDFNNQDNKATLLKIGSNGDSLTSVLDAPQSHYKDAMVTANKEIVIVGESGTSISSKQPIYISKYTNGNQNFNSSIILNNYDNVQVKDVCQTADGNFVVVGTCFNFSSTSLRYGFLIKTDASGNKIWEKVLTQFNGSEITSCVEKQADVFYLGVGGYNSGNLYKYDLTNLTVIDNQYRQPDAQLLIKNGTLHRGIIEANASFYQTVKLKVYSIN